MKPFHPNDAIPGNILTGIDPSTLLSNRSELELTRLETQRRLIATGQKRHTLIQVNRDGVIFRGITAPERQPKQDWQSMSKSLIFHIHTVVRSRPFRSQTGDL